MESLGAEETEPFEKHAQDVERFTPLTYQIPIHVYRNAIIASPTTMGAYWSYKLYRNAEGKPPTVFYCINYEQAESRARMFLDEPVVGFDIEWESWASVTKAGIKQNVSLIQIAAEHKICLFHVAVFQGDTVDKLMPPSLRQILESRAVVKAGVNIAGDAKRLRECLDVEMQGLFELSHLYRLVTFSETSPELVNRKLWKLADQVHKTLGLPLKKDDVRTSAWSRRLQLEQTEYAASDAYAGFRLYHALEAKRKKMQPMPTRPAFYEDQKPIMLGDGTVAVPRPQPSKRKIEVRDEVEKVEEDIDEEEHEESFEELEEALDLDSSQSSALSNAEFQVDVKKPRADTKGHPPASAEVALADAWVSNFRQDLPVEYHLKANPASLRAWHLWHHQSLNCAQVANLLREPPLMPQTVASYVLEALKLEDLPFDAARVQEVVEILPKSVRWRYQKVWDRMEARG
ncbi:ribonuclease H-like domain-containing protein [Neohortaea acidophila]|uniref:Ribonuclease H-like domain-containing protein n=1 Tax=Neohortaea acidophila TaxID=245834 RepID=A0A6A6PMU0_9PEZI|nr:ribonuclease H-like domain-containing protein [Neohortaea acidophila]KAF2481011.1 ribonuclease H-like domain-containing protein [Neohortaea acidophila]